MNNSVHHSQNAYTITSFNRQPKAHVDTITNHFTDVGKMVALGAASQMKSINHKCSTQVAATDEYACG